MFSLPTTVKIEVEDRETLSVQLSTDERYSLTTSCLEDKVVAKVSIP